MVPPSHGELADLFLQAAEKNFHATKKILSTLPQRDSDDVTHIALRCIDKSSFCYIVWCTESSVSSSNINKSAEIARRAARHTLHLLIDFRNDSFTPNEAVENIKKLNDLPLKTKTSCIAAVQKLKERNPRLASIDGSGIVVLEKFRQRVQEFLIFHQEQDEMAVPASLRH